MPRRLGVAIDTVVNELKNHSDLSNVSESLEQGDTVTHQINRVVEIAYIYEDRQTARVISGADSYEVDLDELTKG